MSALILIADDMRLRLYNYNTMEKVKDMEAHADYIRFVEIHPTLPYILSSSDDMSIKLWNWEQNWDIARRSQFICASGKCPLNVSSNPDSR